jgi:predicted nucleic acid-binding protein
VLVADAGIAVRGALVVGGWNALQPLGLVAPPLLWSEATSALHESMWRGDISSELGNGAIARLADAPIERRASRRLYREAWSVAERLGWAKTYDAEFVALALLSRCPLLTIDERLKRGAARLVEVVGPADL